MIHFFRRIRQGLLTQNRFSKYLLYAIGEILLVVVGILIALQVNNWNEERILKQTELSYYSNIKNQITEDKKSIQDNARSNSDYINTFLHAKEILRTKDKSSLDTLMSIVPGFLFYSDFDKKGNIYETLVNSGQINVLSNQNIVNAIQDLEDNYLYINRMENIHFDLINSHVFSSIIEVIDLDNKKSLNMEKLYSHQFQNIISMLLHVMNEKNDVYKNTIDLIDSIIYLLNKELILIDK